MNFSSNKSTGSSFPISSVEIAILQQDIELPELPKVTQPDEMDILKVLDLKEVEEFAEIKALEHKAILVIDTEEMTLESREPYKFMEREYKNMLGNFYIPALFPLIENGESIQLEYDAPDSGNIINGTLTGAEYIEQNYIQLIIPKYIVMNFEKIIPQGTKFLVGIVDTDNYLSPNDISIIGLYGADLSLE